MSARQGLSLGTLAAAASALFASLRAADWLHVFLLLWASSSLVLAPLCAAWLAAQPLSQRARVALSSLACCGLPVAALAALIKVATHHRPLGAVTFALLTLPVVTAALVLALRVHAALAQRPDLARWFARALTSSALLSLGLLLAFTLKSPDLRPSLLDLSTACGAVALLLLVPWRAGVRSVLHKAGVPLFVVAIAIGVGLGASARQAADTSPALAASLTWALD